MTQIRDAAVTVHSLQESGYKVNVEHFRVIQGFRNPTKCTRTVDRNCINAKGGITRVSVELPEMGELFGISYCSDSDNYDKRIGAHIALMRALGKKPKSNGNRILTPVLNSITDKQEYENRQ